jgi:hypothetical protein
VRSVLHQPTWVILIAPVIISAIIVKRLTFWTAPTHSGQVLDDSGGVEMNHTRITRRAVATVATTAAAALVWGVQAVLGVGVRMPSYGEVGPLPLVAVVVTALAGTLAGWGALAVLERFAPRRAAVTWLVAAGALFLLSLFGPLAMPGVGLTDRVWLVVLHVVVAGTFVGLVSRTLSLGRAVTVAPTGVRA